jgi:hypothetical protein
MALPMNTALVGSLAAATLLGAVAASSTTAQAQSYYPYRGTSWGYGSGYYPASYRHRRHHSYYGRRDNTGAAIAGLVGGLALGALAAQPYYAQPYPSYGATYYGGYQNCWIERRRLKTNSGRPLYEDRQVCR